MAPSPVVIPDLQPEIENAFGLKIQTKEPSPAPAGDYVPLITKINQRISAGDNWFSMEFFPPRTKDGATNLLHKFENMGAGGPLFCDITWHPAGNPGSEEATSCVTIADAMLNYIGLETMLHMTCCSMSSAEIKKHLDRIKSLGIRNILALRGDPPVGQEEWEGNDDGFNYATDLVKFIRQNFGDHFNICVAGYPNGHPDSTSYKDDLFHLQEKISAGSDFIITQLFFESKDFINYVKDCRDRGINIPIIPGILPIQGFASLRHICKLGKMDVPDFITRDITPIKDNDEAIRKYGIDFAVRQCRELLDSGVVQGLHFYTLNREVATIEILKRLGMWLQDPQKSLPWKTTANYERASEAIRPIFWSSRPQSYVHRTRGWDEFPNGRWGDSSSPSFGALKDYHIFYLKSKWSKKALLPMWGDKIEKESDVWDIFTRYLTGEKNSQGEVVKCLPWNDYEIDLDSETCLIIDELVKLNRRGILTINSQPNANAVPSDDKTLGWGDKNGFVFQKAYLEFFISQRYLASLLTTLSSFPSVNFHIVNHNGAIDLTNCDRTEPVAVTWGVFPGREIAQPTVVDPVSFRVWKDEAFALWLEKWARLYDADESSKDVIQGIHDSYLLVNLVDNNFPSVNCLWELLAKIRAD